MSVRFSFVILFFVTHSAFADRGAHDHEFVGDVQAFHEVLSPLWHATANEMRKRNTCNAIPSMQTMASQMKYPSANALVQAIDNLQKTCSDKLTQFDASFVHVHDLFHKVWDESKKKK